MTTQLEEDNEEEKPRPFKRLKTTFFYVVFIVIIAIDMYVFTKFNDWGSSISILILELLLILSLARSCHIEYLEILTEKILNYTNNK